MVMFTHITLLNPPIHKIAVRAVTAIEVFAHRN